MLVIEDYVEKNIKKREHSRNVEMYFDKYIYKHRKEDKNILSAEGYDIKIAIMRIFDKAENPESLMDIPIKELVANYS